MSPELMSDSESIYSDPSLPVDGVVTSRLTLASWNINGLGCYKHADLLALMEKLEIDALAVCETHLVNSEQTAQWELAVANGPSVWYGRPAVRIEGDDDALATDHGGRGSGGVGILVRRDLMPYCQSMQCDHPSLLFIRLQPPDLPFALFIGVVYMLPVGSRRYGENDSIMAELEARIAEYSALGAVVVMGDFNVHIGQRPSTIAVALPAMLDEMEESGPVAGEDTLVLTRTSVDASVSADGQQFVSRMDSAGMVILNGLHALDASRPAQATSGRAGSTSVVDYILADQHHWRNMEPVTVERHHARAEVATDHELLVTAMRYQPAMHAYGAVGPDEHVTGDDDVEPKVTTTRYCIEGAPAEKVDAFKEECARSLDPLSRQWEAAMARGDRMPIESLWHQFHSATHAAAASAFGVKDGGDGATPGRQPVHCHHDAQLAKFKALRQDLWAKLRDEQRNGGDAVALADVERQIRPVNMHIKRHARSARREAQQREVRRLQEAMPAKAYWRALRRIGNMYSQGPPIPLTALRTDGTEATAPSEVRDVWHDAWAQLARHTARDDPRFDPDFHQRVEAELAAWPADAANLPAATQTRVRSASELNTAITMEEVLLSIRRLKSGKAPGSDGVCAEALKHGGDSMVRCLHRLLSIVWAQSEVPTDWLKGIIAPIHKDGEMRLPLNYRPITLLSIAGKVYTGVLQARLMAWAETHGAVVQEQGGFRPRRGCPEQVFTLTELIKLRRLNRKHTYACFIDIRKAYDTVWHAGLKLKLRQAGIHGPMYDALCSLYSGCESSVRLGATLGYTEFFPIETGVRQGCILSPLLYSLFINDLALELKKLEQEGVGVPIGLSGRRLVTLLYADDIVLLAENPADLQRLMAVVHSYARRWRFEINHSKCGLMCFRPSGSALPTVELTIGPKAVPWVSSYRYLGVELHAGVPFRMMRQRLLQSATRCAYAVSGLGLYSGKLPVPIGVQAYTTLVRPLLEYCCEVWSTSHWKDAERLQCSMAKRILACPIQTSSEAVRGELGLQCLEARHQQARVGFWLKLMAMPLDAPVRLVYEASQAYSEQYDDASVLEYQPLDGAAVIFAPVLRDGLTLWPAQLKRDLHELGMGALWRDPTTVAEAARAGNTALSVMAHAAVQQREQRRWWQAVCMDPRLQRVYRHVHSGTLELQPYLTVRHGGWHDQRLIGRRHLTALRCGSARLRILTDGWAQLPLAARLCQLCGLAVETEAHVLLDCHFHRHVRAALFDAIDAIVRTDASFGPAAPPTAQLPAAAQLVLLTSGRCPWVDGLDLQLQLLPPCLLAITAWMQARVDALDALDA
jgi:hypothetical protein